MNSKQSTVFRFAKRLAIFLIFQSIVGLTLSFYSSPASSNHYLAALRDKIQHLESLPDSRVAILGGSNTCFGIHSEIFEQNLQRGIANLGLHVSLGLEFQLNCYLQHAQSGDVVMICPEYHVLMDEKNRQGDPVVINQLLEQFPEAKKYFRDAGDKGWKEFLDHQAVLDAHQWVHRSIKMIHGRDKAGKTYRRSSFNKHGDLTAHYGVQPSKLMPVSTLKAPDNKTLKETVAILNRFHETCRHQDISVYLAFPPLARSTYDSSADAIRVTANFLDKHCSIEPLNRPEDNVYQNEQFFDSAYHLDAATGEVQSENLALALKERIQHRPVGSTPRQPEQVASAVKIAR